VQWHATILFILRCQNVEMTKTQFLHLIFDLFSFWKKWQIVYIISYNSKYINMIARHRAIAQSRSHRFEITLRWRVSSNVRTYPIFGEYPPWVNPQGDPKNIFFSNPSRVFPHSPIIKFGLYKYLRLLGEVSNFNFSTKKKSTKKKRFSFVFYTPLGYLNRIFMGWYR